MSTANRRAEFFALEASEYLAELEPIAARTEPPDLERLVRGARALRGAALMAGLGTFARAAAGLESIARHVRDHALGWEPHARPAWREGLQTLRGLVARATVWEAADDRHALALSERLERAASGQTAEAPPAKPQTPIPSAEKGPALSPGVRAFIARESELIASSLLEASRALAPMAPNIALSGVLDRLRSLRGVGSAGELSPLPELLDAMEATTRSVLDNPDPPPGVAAVFADAADALVSMARSVAQDGHVLVPAGLDNVAERLLDAFSRVEVPGAIASGRTAVAHGETAEPIPIELVGVGDHFQIQAEALGRYTSPAARSLRLFVLHRTLSTMPAKGGTGSFIAPLAAALTRVIASGEATTAPDRFVAMLRETGELLIESAGNRDGTSRLAARDRLAAAIAGDLAAAATSSTPPESSAADELISIDALAPEDDVVAIGSLAPDDEVMIDSLAPDDDVIAIDSLAPEDDVVTIGSLAPGDDLVTIESLAPDYDLVSIESLAPEDDVVPIDSLAPDEDVIPIAALAPDRAAHAAGFSGTGRLSLAYRRRSALRREGAGSAPSLDALLGERMMAIELLLYRGDRALARAEEVRHELTLLLSEPTLSLDRLRPLIDELLDLVPLARDAA